MAKIGKPRESASRTASNSQRSRAESTSLLITLGSTISWRKNSGEISEPPVSKSPSICSNGTVWFSAFQTLISGCLAKMARKDFVSLGRIQVARLGIGEFATSLLVCKEQSHDFPGRYFGKSGRRAAKNSSREQGTCDRSSAARFRERFSIFHCRRSLVSRRQHDQSRSAPRDFSRCRRGSPSAGGFTPRAKPF